MDKKRIFLAIEVTQQVQGEIWKISQQLKDLGFQLRLTQKANLHITLVFLPKVETVKLPKVSEITKSIAQKFSPSSLFLNSLGAFPNLKLPKTIYISLIGEVANLTNFAKKIQNGLKSLGFVFDSEKFTLHITIGRIKSYVAKVERRKLGETIQRWGKLPPLKIPVEAVSVFESTPTSAGHIHTLLEKINLGKNENPRN